MTDKIRNIDRKDSQRLPSYFLRITKRLIKVIDFWLSSSSAFCLALPYKNKADDKLTEDALLFRPSWQTTI